MCLCLLNARLKGVRHHAWISSRSPYLVIPLPLPLPATFKRRLLSCPCFLEEAGCSGQLCHPDGLPATRASLMRIRLRFFSSVFYYDFPHASTWVCKGLIQVRCWKIPLSWEDFNMDSGGVHWCFAAARLSCERKSTGILCLCQVWSEQYALEWHLLPLCNLPALLFSFPDEQSGQLYSRGCVFMVQAVASGLGVADTVC